MVRPRAWALGLLGLATAASAQCDRAVLLETTRRYVAAQSLGESRYMKFLSPEAAYLENDRDANITAGILSVPVKIDHHRSIHDTVKCATYTEIISADPAHPRVIGTQMWLKPSSNGTASGASITRIETLVTDAEDWLFNAQHTLHYALQETSWEPIPEAKRDSRAVIQAAADAYLDLFKNASVVVPWGDECRRLEGGLYTAPGDTCNSGVPSGIDLVNRRYVIDESMGIVDVFLTFGGGESGSRLPDSHEFRVEGGKIRYVHTITVCWTPNCGFDPPERLLEEVGW